MVSTAAKILCFVDVEIEEIIYCDICEYGDLRRYQVILLTSVKDLASIFVFSEPLFQVWIPFKGCCQAAVINYIWTEGGKSKRGSLDACLKTSFTLMFERKEPKTEEKIVPLLLGHIPLTGMEGSDFTSGKQMAILFQTSCFCLTQLDCYFTQAPAHCKQNCPTWVLKKQLEWEKEAQW